MESIAIQVENLSKVYKLYEKKSDRLKEALSLSGKKYYKEFYALNDISFEVRKGETVGIIGTNGSGKSTLLKILTGVVASTGGSARVEGKISALLELGAGFNPEYTGIENIMLNGTMMGYSRAEMEKRVDGIVSFADIGDYINQPVKNYSSGMFARLAFAVAISVEPEVLIVDETLSVGDMRFQIKCMDRMKNMMENGTTILLVSHDTNTIRRFCRRTLWLNRGTQMVFGETNYVADMYEDFLKCQTEANTQAEAKPEEPAIGDVPFVSKNKDVIAEIVGFELTSLAGRVIGDEVLRYDDPVKVTVTYDVYDSDLAEPVLGVSLLGVDDEYICGLNTLLDHKRIPWEFGRNQVSLMYPEGLRVLGGRYHFDCALIDQTATIFIQHRQGIRDITVDSGYVAEGKLSIPHKWID